MRIVVATPLYPPDIAEPAPYVKELVRRLSKLPGYEVTVVAYGALPEEVEGVRIIAVSKQRPVPFRLASFTLALLQAVMNADVVLALNGPSVELPASIVRMLTGRTFIACIGDKTAHESATGVRKSIEHFMRQRASAIIELLPHARPELLPFTERPVAALDAYERSWEEHLRVLDSTFTHA